MPQYTKESILRICEEQNVRIIRLQFTDIVGSLKNVAITRCQLERALDNKCMFDGSSIEGFVRIEESDMYLYPDYDSFVIYPWETEDGKGKVARLICDVYRHDGKPFEGDPRYILKRAIAKASSMGYTFNVGPECEFFLFQRDASGKPTVNTHDQASYFDLGPVDKGEQCRREICFVLEEMGFKIEASHHEVAEAQHEIDFRYDEALRTADNVMTFKYAVKSIAHRHGLHATFMPKPIFGICGSGMHTNMSLFRGEENAFYDEKDPIALSRTAYSFIAGIIEHIKPMTLILNPLVNSYKRLVPGYEAPVYIAWSAKNRSPLIRVPASRGTGTRVELRSPDPSCNPYLEIAACLAAGLDGIERGLVPAASTDTNIYDMTKAERDEVGIETLPGSLEEAIDLYKKDAFVREVLGDHVFFKYLEAKKEEWKAYRMRVSQWELDRYLEKY
ncbi:MAG TPA: type I glutamate--ammonia ligase [Clostridiales bacterium]|nr:MAG: Glutamine synthetase [Firmicutes bacterium ADurb.Bin262]HOU09759.1 type I glutamate--ammonia ligase [Clostridiales bacterium]HQH62942.1 type I glutamate--ammonia ligase [Clostridiales bacterium]HQK72550.1 type I glutamate--ammonia ligase [Clostridiales bacterium]